MTYSQVRMDAVEEGIEIGKKEGIEIGKKEGIIENLVSLVRKGYLSAKVASKEASMTENEFMALVNPGV